MAATEFFGIDGKTRLKPDVWKKSKMGRCKVFKINIYEHNIADVEILEDLHRKLRRTRTTNGYDHYNRRIMANKKKKRRKASNNERW